MLKALKSLKVVIDEMALILSSNRMIQKRTTLFCDYWRFNVMRKLVKLFKLKRQSEKFLGYKVYFPDYDMFYGLWVEIFLKEAYFFKADNPTPRIFDLGSSIGMSILFFKYLYPSAIITGFEAVPANFRWLEKNIKENNLSNVKVYNIAVADRETKMTIFVDSLASSTAHSVWPDFTDGVPETVEAKPLSQYLTSPIDFLKVDIEGSEYVVFKEISDRLYLVKALIMEIHQRRGIHNEGLDEILRILDKSGFRYSQPFSNYISVYKFMNDPSMPYNFLLAAVRVD